MPKHPITPPPPQEDLPTEAVAPAAEAALVPACEAVSAETAIATHPMVARLPVELEVGVPVRDFRVCNLLALELGVIVESQWNMGEDLPLAAGNVHLAWTEFEVVDTQLAARLTRLA
jgi:hypothetical protein